jgi:hypothetical protein
MTDANPKLDSGLAIDKENTLKIDDLASLLVPTSIGAHNRQIANSSGYIPNFTNFMLLIFEVDSQLMNNVYFNREIGDGYIPAYAMTYYSIIAHYLIFKQMRIAGKSTLQMNQFIEFFDHNIGAETVIIDDLAKHFLTSLLLSRPGNDTDNDFVYPYIPNFIKEAECNFYYRIDIFGYLPNIHGLLNILSKIRRGNYNANLVNYDTTTNLHVGVYQDAVENEQPINANRRLIPGFMQSMRHKPGNIAQVRTNRFLPRVPQPGNPTDWIELFRFQDGVRWFKDLTGLITKRNLYIKGRNTLDKIIGEQPYNLVTLKREPTRTILQLLDENRAAILKNKKRRKKTPDESSNAKRTVATRSAARQEVGEVQLSEDAPMDDPEPEEVIVYITADNNLTEEGRQLLFTTVRRLIRREIEDNSNYIYQFLTLKAQTRERPMEDKILQTQLALQLSAPSIIRSLQEWSGLTPITTRYGNYWVENIRTETIPIPAFHNVEQIAHNMLTARAQTK